MASAFYPATGAMGAGPAAPSPPPPHPSLIPAEGSGSGGGSVITNKPISRIKGLKPRQSRTPSQLSPGGGSLGSPMSSSSPGINVFGDHAGTAPLDP